MGLQTPSYLLPSEAPPGIQASRENTCPEITETRSFDIQMGKPRSRAGRGPAMSAVWARLLAPQGTVPSGIRPHPRLAGGLSGMMDSWPFLATFL